MINQQEYLSEMLDGIRRAFSVMRHEYPDVEIYTISVWTDVKARKSAVCFDTLENSEVKRTELKAHFQQLHDRFKAEGDLKRLSLPLPNHARNENPADFKLRNMVLIDNNSLADADFADAQEWAVFEDLMEQVKSNAAKEAAVLKLHPDAELGVNGHKTWYHRAVKLRGS